jgi:tetratricopeptide (TPR) repeat protein
MRSTMPFCRRFLLLLLAFSLTVSAADNSALLKAGTQAARKGHFEEAVGLLTEAIAASPQSAEPYVCRSQSYAALNRADEAIKDMAEAIRLEPGERNHLLASARLYDTLNRTGDAIKECTRALEMKKDAGAFQLRAQLNARAGKYLDAVADYTNLL